MAAEAASVRAGEVGPYALVDPFAVCPALELGHQPTHQLAKIARAGKGHCIPFEDAALVLRQVLSLAVGREYRKNIDAVYKVVTRRNEKIAPKELDLVRRGDLEGIEHALRKNPVRDDIVKALLRCRNPKIFEHLAGLLGKRGFPLPGRHAVAHVLWSVLELRQPPLDPEKGRRISARKVEALKQQIRRRF